MCAQRETPLVFVAFCSSAERRILDVYATDTNKAIGMRTTVVVKELKLIVDSTLGLQSIMEKDADKQIARNADSMTTA